MNTLKEIKNIEIELEHFDYGAERYIKTGISIPEEQFDEFRSGYDAIFVGALGDPRIPDMSHAKDILLGLRFKLDLYVNYRPIKLIDEKLCPLKNKKPEDVNFVVFRENTEGMYVGLGGIFKKNTPDEIAIQESLNTRKGVERIIRYAFEYARKNNLSKVTMSDKSNAQRFEGDLWQRTFNEIGEEYPDIEKQHLYVDALVMQMVKRPEQFEVIVTCNMFGDIVTDLGGQLQGGLGIAASGNINPGKVSMFEPVHGSAPKYMGKNIANPVAAISSAQLMLEYLGFYEAASYIEKAVVNSIKKDMTTRDLGGKLGTKEVGDFICEEIKRISG
ncbi:3-isopropylmalate dehydrogenase [candidate division KSB1 bacterium]|nr:MAG: 3-isopropylmalate dehydrogenase [candidate division KSB1 bacterium]